LRALPYACSAKHWRAATRASTGAQALPHTLLAATSAGAQQLLVAALPEPQRLGVPPSDALLSRRLAAAVRARWEHVGIGSGSGCPASIAVQHKPRKAGLSCAVSQEVDMQAEPLWLASRMARPAALLCTRRRASQLPRARQDFIQGVAPSQPAAVPALRVSIAAVAAAQPVLQQGPEAAPGEEDGAAAALGADLPATAVLLRGLILLADLKFGGATLLPPELLASLPLRCAPQPQAQGLLFADCSSSSRPCCLPYYHIRAQGVSVVTCCLSRGQCFWQTASWGTCTGTVCPVCMLFLGYLVDRIFRLAREHCDCTACDTLSTAAVQRKHTSCRLHIM
jgi:hypothetical protein